MENDRPKVGLGVMVIREGKILLGKRKSAHGEGEYAGPGGHLEFGESFEQCARREVKEETGLEITNIRFLRLMNLTTYSGKHYVDVALVANWKRGKPQILEPHKCESWDWYAIDSLPTPLFGTIASCVEAYQTGKNYFDFTS